jgi:hypothetical protein
MAWDDSEATYHLTPRGWETGDPPSDRVETWVRHVYQTSGYSREQVSWHCEWVDPSVGRVARDEFRAKHKAFMGRPGRSGSGLSARETTIGEPL